MRTKVMEILASKDLRPNQKFNQLLGLFPQIPGTSPHQFRYFNQVGYSPQHLSNLEYDLKKLLNITDSEVHSYGIEVTPEVVSLEVSYKDMSYAELKSLAKEISEKTATSPKDWKKATLIEFLESNPVSEENPFDVAPESAKEGLKLRDIYPFLRDADCPNEFKILVADKITAFEAFVKSREELVSLEGTEEFEKMAALAAQAVDNFELDVLIHDELTYYLEHKEILGKHPIFADYMLSQKVNAYSPVELVKRQKTLRANISRDNKKIATITDAGKKADFAAKIKEWVNELELVDKRIESIA